MNGGLKARLPATEEGWVPKFAGYEAGVNLKNTFRVEDGILKVSYNEYEKFAGEFGHLFYKEPFGRYVLRVEYRFKGEQTPTPRES